MGSPRQTFARETRSSRQCHAGGQGSQGMECLPLKIYPDLPKQPLPCLSPEDEEEKDQDAEKPGLSSFRKYLSKTKRSAPPQNAPTPSARLSTFRQLSFKMNSSRN